MCSGISFRDVAAKRWVSMCDGRSNFYWCRASEVHRRKGTLITKEIEKADFASQGPVCLPHSAFGLAPSECSVNRKGYTIIVTISIPRCMFLLFGPDIYKNSTSLQTIGVNLDANHSPQISIEQEPRAKLPAFFVLVSNRTDPT